MKNNRLRMIIVPLIYILAISSFLTSIYFLQKSLTSNTDGTTDDSNVVIDDNDDETDPVASVGETIAMPFSSESVSEYLGFYPYKGSEEDQLKAIYFEDKTYYQNFATNYKSDSKFEVQSILSGVVVKVDSSDPKLGVVVEVQHENGLVSRYSSLSDVSVNHGDQVKQGQVIGHSGTNGFFKDSENQLIFELLKDSAPMNPKDMFNKKLSEIE